MKTVLQIVLLIFAILYFFGAAFDKRKDMRYFYFVCAMLITAAIIVTICIF